MSKPQKVKLIVGMISTKNGPFFKTERLLVKKFGPIDLKSNAIAFSYTKYYEKEIGKNLKRKFLSFKKLIDPSKLGSIKNFTIQIEKKLSRKNGSRRINLDPGYITLSNLILATTKDFSHRIYLGKGIFAEVTLLFQNSAYRSLEWTYPDYKTKKYQNFLVKVRKVYKNQLEQSK